MLKRLVRSLLVVSLPLGSTLGFWLVFGAMTGSFGCIDQPIDPPPPIATVFAAWDPLACPAEPHRVAIELHDDAGAAIAASAPCARGGVTLEVEHYGRFRGRIYAWVLGEGERAERTVELTIDADVIHWQLEVPAA